MTCFFPCGGAALKTEGTSAQPTAVAPPPARQLGAPGEPPVPARGARGAAAPPGQVRPGPARPAPAPGGGGGLRAGGCRRGKPHPSGAARPAGRAQGRTGCVHRGVCVGVAGVSGCPCVRVSVCPRVGMSVCRYVRVSACRGVRVSGCQGVGACGGTAAAEGQKFGGSTQGCSRPGCGARGGGTGSRALSRVLTAPPSNRDPARPRSPLPAAGSRCRCRSRRPSLSRSPLAAAGLAASPGPEPGCEAGVPVKRSGTLPAVAVVTSMDLPPHLPMACVCVCVCPRLHYGFAPSARKSSGKLQRGSLPLLPSADL